MYRPLNLTFPVLLATGGLAWAGEPPIAPERPDDPPALEAAADDPAARSPAYRAAVGPYVSVQVNVDDQGRNIVGDAANEPSIVVNPTDSSNMVIGWRQFDSVQSNFRQAGWSYTRDGGATWTFPGTLTPGVFRSDPVLDADAAGNLYYQSLKEDFTLDVFKSNDGGMTWGDPVPSFGGDKNWMAIDRTGGVGDGHIYGIWQRFAACCGSLVFTRSTDGGGAFESPVGVEFSPTFGTLAVGPEGGVYATGIDGRFFQDFNSFVFSKSTNAEDAAQSPVFDGRGVEMGGSMVLGSGPNPGGLLGQAVVAVDQSDGPTRGNLYIVASVDAGGADPLDVHIIRSTDGGDTWSAPVQINNDAPNADAWQWFGTASVGPEGRIDVIWNDTRGQLDTDISELYYAYSWDAGVTWQGNIPVSEPFDSSLGRPNQAKIGDYYTLVSDRTGADAAYSATFNGEQDIYYLRVFPDCNLNGQSDVLDIDSGDSRDDNGDHIPDECSDGLLLASPQPGRALRRNTFALAAGTPGRLVILSKGLEPGTGSFPLCGDLLGIADAQPFGFTTLDDSGAGEIDRFLGPGSRGDLLFQAIELPGCRVSNVVEATIR